MRLDGTKITSTPAYRLVVRGTHVEDLGVLQVDGLADLAVLEQSAVRSWLLNHLQVQRIPRLPKLVRRVVLVDQASNEGALLAGRRGVELVDGETRDYRSDRDVEPLTEALFRRRSLVVLVRMLVGWSGGGIFAGGARDDGSAAEEACGDRSTGGGADGEHRGGPGSEYSSEEGSEVDDMHAVFT